jgi:Bax protein
VTAETGDGIASQPVKANHHRELRQVFNQYNYSWDTLNEGIPPLILSQFPNDLHLIRSTESKKRLFFLSLLPMALLANEEINSQRRTLLDILSEYDSTGGLGQEQLAELAKIQAYYRVKDNPLSNRRARTTLLRRVDTIPPAMILAQAANESGWGTSRFAQRANNLFGEWTFTPGHGLVPENRPEGETYEVRRFNSLYQSVRSYTRNINTHWAYQPLRQLREDLRKDGEQITGLILATELDMYSTRREDYTREIVGLIRSNRLEQLATVRLRTDLTPNNRPKPDEAQGVGLLSSRALLRDAPTSPP